jgi:hypothetical protein
MWCTLAVELSDPGEVHDRSAVNLRAAIAQATPQDIAYAAIGAQEMRRKWKTVADSASKLNWARSISLWDYRLARANAAGDSSPTRRG